MRHRTWLGIIGLYSLLAIALVSDAQAQTQEPYPLSGQAAAVYNGINESGNQSWVREYDGRSYDSWDVDPLYFILSGPDRNLVFTLSSPVEGDESLSLTFDRSYWLWGIFDWDDLTHRLAKQRNGMMVNGMFTTPDTQISRALYARDLDPDGHFAFDRQVFEGQLNGIVPALDAVTWVANYWQERERGDREIEFRSRTSPTVGAVRMFQTGAFVDRLTRETQVGADAWLVNVAFSYRKVHQEFEDGVTPLFPMGLPGFPNGDQVDTDPFPRFDNILFTTPRTETDAHVFKARSEVSERLSLSASYISKQREATDPLAREDPSSFVAPAVPPTPGTHTKVDLKTFNASFAYRPSKDWTVTGRHWSQDIELAKVVGGFTEDTLAEMDQPLSRKVRTWRLDTRYRGLSRVTLRAGFERRKIEREGTTTEETDEAGAPDYDQFFAPVASRTIHKIWNIGLTAYPVRALDLRLDYKHENVDRPTFEDVPPHFDLLAPEGGGVPRTRRTLGAALTYTPRDSVLLYTDYRKLRERNDHISFRNDDTWWTVGLWTAPTLRWTLSTEYNKNTSNLRNWWVFEGGFSDTGMRQNMPWPDPQLVPFDTKNQVWVIGTTWQAARKVKLLANYRHTLSKGHGSWANANQNLTDGTSIGDVVPFDLRITRYSLGASKNVDPDTDVAFEWAHEVWNDRVQPVNIGSFNLWSVSLRKQL